MPDPATQALPRKTRLYVLCVASAGALVISLSVSQVIHQPYQWHVQWLSLVALTVGSGLLPVTLPSINISISISETFVVAGTLLFGAAGGTVLVLLDALFISLRLFFTRRLRWEQIVFNLAASPLALWIAAQSAQIPPLFQTDQKLEGLFLLKLCLFVGIYFLLNSWLLAGAIALQQRVKPYSIWSKYFKDLLVNYGAGGSLGAVLIYNTRTVDPVFVAIIFPLLFVLFLTYQWSNNRVESERQKNAELNRVFLSTVEALALAIDAKDQVTHGHIRRVQRYTMALASFLGVEDQKQIDALRAAALLHDTGKLAVPEYILNKPGPLTASEFERMKLHASVGADILKSIDFPYPVEPIVRHHHENWDGTGYPEGLKGSEIPLGARILSVVDCYDALTSDRPYRPRYSREYSEQVLRERRGVMYDPWVVDGFLAIIDGLERTEPSEFGRGDAASSPRPGLAPAQLEVISATTAEDREFNELRRELPKAGSLRSSCDVLFRHLRRVVPAATLTLYMPKHETNELVPVACIGVGTSAIEDLKIPIGDRISGWAAAHKQVVVNSNAALELGPVARTFSVPLRYALAVPIFSGSTPPIGVLTAYGSEPFNQDHRRILESAATLFASAVAAPATPSDGVGEASVAAQRGDSRIH
ncbi:MAG TPA: HD domain-containing phosphohydrolase [Vicinamibacterales bacterium]|nr:HD domain-containing phosphohydrolase [Vicinamibacterales bacterium]